MKINFILLIVIITVAGLWTYWDQQKQTPNISTPTYADFEFKTLDGKKHTFYDYKNKIVFVHFWATWCTPCLVELPQLIELAQKNPEKITIIAFAVQDTPDKIRAFLDKTNPTPSNFIIALDNDKTISANRFGTKKLPETFIFKPNHILYDKINGAQDDWNTPKWDDFMHNL